MNTLFRILFLFITLTLLFTQCEDIDKVYITDIDFFNALIEAGVDTNGDRIISYREAEATIELEVKSTRISYMTGIEAFINLETLFCYNNRLRTLDISNNTALTILNCSNNQLTSLDVSNNTALKSLGCSGNQLTSLDVSNNTMLQHLACGENQLTSLDVSINTSLNMLSCYENQLTSLDISNNTAIGSVTQGYGLPDLWIGNMPTLGEVCVWESFPAGVSYSFGGSPNVYFTTKCSK